VLSKLQCEELTQIIFRFTYNRGLLGAVEAPLVIGVPFWLEGRARPQADNCGGIRDWGDWGDWGSCTAVEVLFVPSSSVMI